MSVLHIPVIRHVEIHPRLVFAALVGIALYCLLAECRLTTRALLAWDGATATYLALAARMFFRSDVDTIKKRASVQDDGRIFVLLMTITIALASLAAIILELSYAKQLSGANEAWHVTLAGVTVFLSWSFMQTIFALHYAHEYYLEGTAHDSSGGLDFPGGKKPDYWDFVYFAFVIGTTAQTSDVEITSRTIRRTVTLHSVVAFFFNATILALTVNIGASFI